MEYRDLDPWARLHIFSDLDILHKHHLCLQGSILALGSVLDLRSVLKAYDNVSDREITWFRCHKAGGDFQWSVEIDLRWLFERRRHSLSALTSGPDESSRVLVVRQQMLVLVLRASGFAEH